MYYALVNYPQIEHPGFHSFRKKYEPYSDLLPAHITFIFPTPETIGMKDLKVHICQVLNHWKPFDMHFCNLMKTEDDHWLFWTAEEGNEHAIKLHDEFYQGILALHLRKDLPYTPHIGLGLFSKEPFDFNSPTAQLTLDEVRYEHARREFQELNIELWARIDRLRLVSINSDFTECRDIMKFRFS